MTITQLPSDDDTVTIKRTEYTRLQERDQWLECLEAAGVDNWDGYEYAKERRMTDPYPYATKPQLEAFREWLGEQPADTFHMAEFQFDENDGLGPHVEHPCLTAACIEGFWDWHSRVVGLIYPPRLPNRDDVFYLREDEGFCYVAGELFTMSDFDKLPAPLRKTIMLAIVDNLITHGKPMWQAELDKHLKGAP